MYHPGHGLRARPHKYPLCFTIKIFTIMKTTKKNNEKIVYFTTDIYDVPEADAQLARTEYADCNDCAPEDVTDEQILWYLYGDCNDFDEVLRSIDERANARGYIVCKSFSSPRYADYYGSGTRYGYKYTDDLASIIRNAGDDVTIYSQGGRLYCDYSHHDGGGTFEIKAVTDAGARLYDAWYSNYDDDRSEYNVLHTMFSVNFYSRRAA